MCRLSESEISVYLYRMRYVMDMDQVRIFFFVPNKVCTNTRPLWVITKMRLIVQPILIYSVIYLFIYFRHSCIFSFAHIRLFIYFFKLPYSRKFPKPESDWLEPVQNSAPSSEREGVILQLAGEKQNRKSLSVHRVQFRVTPSVPLFEPCP